MRQLLERLEELRENRVDAMYNPLWQDFVDTRDLYAHERDLDTPKEIESAIKSGRLRVLADIDALVREQKMPGKQLRKILHDLLQLSRSVAKQRGLEAAT